MFLLVIGGLTKLGLVKGDAAIGTKAAVMHTAIATEGALNTPATVGGAASAAGSGGYLAYKIAVEEKAQKRNRK